MSPESDEILWLMFDLLRLAWPMISIGYRFKLLFLSFLFLLNSFLDAVALYLFAKVFASIAQNDPYSVENILHYVNLNKYSESVNESYQIVIWIVVFLFISKSIGTLILTRRMLRILARLYELSAEQVTTSYFNMDLLAIKARPSYEVFMAVNTGIKDIIIPGIFAYINIAIETIVLTILIFFVLFAGGKPAILLNISFLLVLIITNRIVSMSTRNNAERLSESNLSAAISMQSLIESVREINIFGSLKFFFSIHQRALKKSAESTVTLQTMMFVPKIILETSFLIGVALYTLWNLYFGELSTALVSISFIVAIGSRIIPSLLRLQSSFNQIKHISGSSNYTKFLLDSEDYQMAIKASEREALNRSDMKTFRPTISVDNLCFSYTKSSSRTISNISFNLDEGQSLGIVGHTGCGKSTLIDLILGFIKPDEGACKISGLPSDLAINLWSNKVAYVPQSIALVDGSLKENILLGRNEKSFSEKDFQQAIDFAGLSDFIDSLEMGLDFELTRSGSELSGGQKQKIGIARAILASPEILILDEFTSSLDAESENAVNSAINRLLGKVTLIVVSHRLTTIKQLERIALIERGELVALDNFENLASTNSTFRDYIEFSRL